MTYVVGSLVAASTALFVASAVQGRDDIAFGLNVFGHRDAARPCTDLGSCAPVLRVCLGWCALYYQFLFRQSRGKFTAHQSMVAESKSADAKPPSFAAVKYGGIGRKYGTLVGDRTVGNMMEQSLPFLVFLGLHAAFVDVTGAAQFGWWWLLTRAIYPACFARGIPMLFVSTLPGYFFIAMLAKPIVVAALLQ